MELEVNVEPPGVDAERQEAPQIIEMDDPDVTKYPHPIESETANKAAFEVPDAPEVMIPAIVEAPGLHRST